MTQQIETPQAAAPHQDKRDHRGRGPIVDLYTKPHRVGIEPGPSGVFHLEDGQMREYWLLERDQGMINDIFNVSGNTKML